ncbi:MAG: hypothetical protein KHX03_00410 [Clostridium sp.]|nr:hypothetical protein [Clostridium sp.]
MKKIILIILLIILFWIPAKEVNAEGMVLKAGVSLSDQVPKGFFGSWKITSVMTYSNNPKIFNETTVDYWNLSKIGDVITLSNPVSGAEASVTVEDVKGNQIKFTHVTKGRNGKMTETPTLTLNGENFYGTDKIVVEKYKYGELISSDTVVYKIKAEKLSGNSAKSIFMSEK